MRFDLRWCGDEVAYVLASTENRLATWKAGFVRRRGDGLWQAHAWPRQAMIEFVERHPGVEEAANWVADEWERPRPPRPPLEGVMPRKLRRKVGA